MGKALCLREDVDWRPYIVIWTLGMQTIPGEEVMNAPWNGATVGLNAG